MDLLLYLVRKHEVEIVDIPIALITDQYLSYLAVLEQLDVNAVGDFLAMAAWLIEIKSQQVLPRSDEVEEELEDPRQELVARLLEYKRYRDAASMLEECGRGWQQRYPRLSGDLPRREREPGRGADPRGGALGPGQRLRADHPRERGRQAVEHRLRRHAHPRLHGADPRRLVQRGQLAFSELFDAGMHKSALIGIFLAVLELVRHHRVRIEQNELFGEIWLLPDADCAQPLDLSDVDNYEAR